MGKRDHTLPHRIDDEPLYRTRNDPKKLRGLGDS